MRFLVYFEHFLRANIKSPYVTSVEQFLKQPEDFTNLHLNRTSLQLKQICIGPLDSSKAAIRVCISDFDVDNIYDSDKANPHLSLHQSVYVRTDGKRNEYYLVAECVGRLLQFEQDICIMVAERVRSIKFYYWLNVNYVARGVDAFSRVESVTCRADEVEANLLPKELEGNLKLVRQDETVGPTEEPEPFDDSGSSLDESDLERELVEVIEAIKIDEKATKSRIVETKRETTNRTVHKMIAKKAELDKFAATKYRGEKAFRVVTSFVSVD